MLKNLVKPVIFTTKMRRSNFIFRNIRDFQKQKKILLHGSG